MRKHRLLQGFVGRHAPLHRSAQRRGRPLRAVRGPRRRGGRKRGRGRGRLGLGHVECVPERRRDAVPPREAKAFRRSARALSLVHAAAAPRRAPRSRAMHQAVRGTRRSRQRAHASSAPRARRRCARAREGRHATGARHASATAGRRSVNPLARRVGALSFPARHSPLIESDYFGLPGFYADSEFRARGTDRAAVPTQEEWHAGAAPHPLRRRHGYVHSRQAARRAAHERRNARANRRRALQEAAFAH
ncbi:hypothetical protein PSP6_130053 [Paraburkholderia tropica]|nr:hypothetical protein PSP6_130053 [Paraburkholderia tropica]